MKGEWLVYIIQTESGKLYTGITNDVKRRFEEHRKRAGGARFFRFETPKKIVLTEPHSSRSEASKRESIIKKMSRKEKLALIERSNLGKLS